MPSYIIPKHRLHLVHELAENKDALAEKVVELRTRAQERIEAAQMQMDQYVEAIREQLEYAVHDLIDESNDVSAEIMREMLRDVTDVPPDHVVIQQMWTVDSRFLKDHGLAFVVVPDEIEEREEGLAEMKTDGRIH